MSVQVSGQQQDAQNNNYNHAVEMLFFSSDISSQ